ncbi:MAG: hypothetical protein QOI45_2162 [Thermoleophilaceae bacterium]|nr:hypothetical protein [Thermoleophilaceae bacterium]
MNARGALIDLDRPRDLGEILNGAFRLYRARFSVFAIIALAVVVPVDVLVYGVAGEWLWTNRDFGDSIPVGAQVASWLAPWLVTTPLITAGHVYAVMDLGAGRPASARRSLAAAAKRLTPVAAVVTLAGLGSTVGLVFLIVPGVYLWARWFLSAQAVVAEQLGPLDGLARSADLVRGRWRRVFGIALVISLVAGVLAALLAVPLEIVGYLADSGPLVLLGQIAADAISLSFAALAGTLLFFDARARKGGAPAAAAPPDLAAPERPA